MQFQPTRPLRGATVSMRSSSGISLFQPTRPLRGATPASVSALLLVSISTHAPLAGRDIKRLPPPHHIHYFNPRAPCGARPVAGNVGQRRRHFNPRAPCGARRKSRLVINSGNFISTHAPLAGRDRHPLLLFNAPSQFQPTRPLRGATGVKKWWKQFWLHFNPRAPCGARLWHKIARSFLPLFQPTRPLRGATVTHYINDRPLKNFNPRAPCGARLFSVTFKVPVPRFQPTRPLRGATPPCRP